jgi:hypothetical protein
MLNTDNYSPKTMKKSILLFTLLSFIIVSASARLLSVKATLNGASVVPLNVSTGTGTFYGTIDDATGLLSFTVTYTGLSSAVSTSRLYAGAAGTNGTQIASFGVIPSPFSTTYTLNATQVTDLLNGNIYFQIHTSNNTGGEIRGQLAIFMEIFSATNQNDFYNIGGYTFFETNFTNISTQNPYSLSGPLPQNDFTFVATSPQGFNGGGLIITKTPNQPIIITFPSNNIRKMSFLLSTPGENILVKANTNLGNSSSFLAGDLSSEYVGFNSLTENEYFTQVEFAAPVGLNTSIAIYELSIGDNSPQNVSLNFDGVNDFVSIPNSVGNFDFLEPFTVSCWVKPDATQPGGSLDVAILEKWDQTGPYPFVIRLLTSGIDAGKVRVARYDGSNNPAINSTTLINDERWHHIAFTTTTGFIGTMNLYIDGVPQGAGTPDNTNTYTFNNSPLFVGQRGNGINRFKGEIDEVRIWTGAKSGTEIQNEMFCKNPNTSNLHAAFNFNNGSSNNDNRNISTVVNSVNLNLSGVLNNFTKNGDASNWVTGQVKYVKNDATGVNNGTSWANAFTNLQSALTSTACNDLFDIYVAKGNTFYKPDASNTNIFFNIPAGMKIYGGFSGTEKNINERNMALIHSTNATTLTGDLLGNDTPFNFASNRADNSNFIVKLLNSNVILDGFKIVGATSSAVKIEGSVSNLKIQNCLITDNSSGSVGAGISVENVIPNLQINNCNFLGNSSTKGALRILHQSSGAITLHNCLFAGNSIGIKVETPFFNTGFNLTNCTLSGNGIAIDEFVGGGATINNNFKNCILHNNNTGISKSISVGGTINDNITYGLVQGIVSGTGNLNGNTTNPNFLNPILYTNPTDAGDYRLNWCSLAIGAGTNVGISTLDLNRNPRNFGGTADMGAYEFLGNTPSPTNAPNSTITGTIDSPTYAGGAIQTISSDAKILAPAGAIDFKAPNAIILNPGFEARGVGKYFKAEIGANVGCAN